MTETVKSLREKGWKVRVLHGRNYSESIIGKSRRFVQRVLKAKGGNTVVELTSPNGKEFSGKARCHPNDNYNKKEGVRIALSNALSSIPNSFKLGQVWEDKEFKIKYHVCRVSRDCYALISLDIGSNRWDDPSSLQEMWHRWDNTFTYVGEITDFIK